MPSKRNAQGKPIRFSLPRSQAVITRVRESIAASAVQAHPVPFKVRERVFGIVALEPGKLTGYEVLGGNTFASELREYRYNADGVLVVMN